MFRSKSFRIEQRKRKINKLKIIANHIFEQENFEDEIWFKIFTDTPKSCKHEHCKNPRRNKWNDTKYKLTNQELRDIDNVKEQLLYL